MSTSGPLLALLTESWPYPSARDGVFIAPEMPFLLQRFPELVVLPRYPDPGTDDAARSILASAAGTGGGRARLDLRLAITHHRRGDLLRASVADAFSPWRKADREPRGLRTAIERWRHRLWARVMARQLEMLVDSHGGPVLLYSYWFTLQSVAAGLVAASRGDVRAATRAHGGDLYEERTPHGYIPLRRTAIRNLGRIACISDHGAAYLKLRHPQMADRIRVHRLATRSHCPIGPTPATDGELVLTSCSYLLPIKRVPRIAAIASGIAIALRRKVRWIHFGGGPEAALVTTAVRDVTLLQAEVTGDVANSHILTHYERQAVHLFINQSISEGMPVSIIEAIGFGIPVVAPAVGGISELIDGSNGFTHPVDAPVDDVVRRVIGFLGDGERYRSARVAARRIWEINCRADVVFPRFADDLHSLF